MRERGRERVIRRKMRRKTDTEQGCIQTFSWGELSKTIIDFEGILDVFKE